jgi:hypothetical protein
MAEIENVRLPDADTKINNRNWSMMMQQPLLSVASSAVDEASPSSGRNEGPGNAWANLSIGFQI